MPSTAFGDTDLVERLDRLGEKFEIISRRDI
jgi:hypothetical protein